MFQDKDSIQSVLSIIKEKLDALIAQLNQFERIENMHFIVEDTLGIDKIDKYYEIIGGKKPDFYKQRSKIEEDIEFLTKLTRRMETKYKSALERSDIVPVVSPELLEKHGR